MYKCWTAPGVQFATREEMHEHYKSEWHKYNLKRKVSNMPPIPKAMFDKLQLIAAEREREKTSTRKGTAHIKQSKRVSDSMTSNKVAPPTAPGQEGVHAAGTTGANSQGASDDSAQSKLGPQEYQVDIEELKKPVDERICFMDGHQSSDLNETMVHLHKTFGFFVPDAEYCTDLPGLFKYINKKVSAGKMCLFCQRGFHSAESVIQHMVAKSHCKIPWEEEEDLEEYDDFYDYSALAGEDGDGEQAASAKSVEMMNTGELLLTDKETGKSKIIGHRHFRLTYKQPVYKTEETRPAFLANSKERLLLAYKRAGVDTSSALTKPVKINGGRPEWMTKKLAQHQRRTIYYEKKLSLRDGMQINLQTKNLQHRTKNMGAGFGVHG